MKKKIALATLLTLLTASNLIHFGSPNGEFRKPGLQIEISIGECLNDNGDGFLFNGEDYYNYIAYSEDINRGDLVASLFIYNPLTTWCDDIIYRHDFILGKDGIINE